MIRRVPHPFGGWPFSYEEGPSLSRTRLRSLPFFCLSVSGRKLAPSAPSLKRVSRTESGQLASGWHHSSPFPDGPAERFMTMRRTARLGRPYLQSQQRCPARPSRRMTHAIARTARRAETDALRGPGERRCQGSGQLLDDDLEYTHSNGDLDYQEVVHRFADQRQARLRLDHVATIETVRIFGDVGVIRGKAKVTVADNGQIEGPAHRLHRHLGVERRPLADDRLALARACPTRPVK